MKPGSLVLVRSTHEFVRRLSGRYLAVLALVATLIVIDQAIIQPLLQQTNAFAPSINIAGRQRMLSQKLTKSVLAVASKLDSRTDQEKQNDIESALSQWIAEHSILVNTYRVPEMNDALRSEWNALEPHYQAMVVASGQVLGYLRMPNSMESEAITSPSPVVPAAEVLLQHESQFLSKMDSIVHLLEVRAGESIGRLQRIDMAIGAGILICIILLGWLVVRPATRTIRKQVESLETRVEDRTKELKLALNTLRHEAQQRETAELKSKQLSMRLMHADRVMTMGHLTVGIAHELKQPLAAIANYAETCDILLEQHAANSDMSAAHSLLSSAKQAAHRAGQILRRMSNFVRPQDNDIAPTDLHQLVREIADLMRPELTASHTHLELHLMAGRRMFHGDPIQIQQVLINLIQNSLQAMRASDCKRRSITIRTSSGEGRNATAIAHTLDGRSIAVNRRLHNSNEHDTNIRLEISDSGPGFRTDQIDDVFSPFTTTKADGLGIGLAICRSIIENHHGKIWIATPNNHGATLVLTLPTIESNANNAPAATDCLCC